MPQTQNSCNQNQTGFQSLNNATGNMAGRDITAGVSGAITITNGDGVSGNPIIDLSTPVSAANGGTGVSSPTAFTLPVANGASAMSFVGPLTNGQLLVGSTGATPVAAALTAGSGISITNGAGSITISSPSSYNWNDVTGTSQAIAVQNAYLSNNASLVTFTLPATAVQFSTVKIAGNGAGGWLIAQNAGQVINFDGVSTTTGVSGSLASTNRYDVIELLCVVANTTWNVISSVGNILVT